MIRFPQDIAAAEDGDSLKVEAVEGKPDSTTAQKLADATNVSPSKDISYKPTRRPIEVSFAALSALVLKPALIKLSC